MSLLKRNLFSTIFHRTGIWVWNTPPTESHIKDLKARNVKWVAIKIHDGNRPYSQGENIRQWIDLCRKHNIRIGGWGYLTGKDVIGEAAVAARLVTHYRLSFYIADAEVEYETSTAPLSTTFARHFAAAHPKLPRALSSFGRIDLHPKIEWEAWRHYGFGFLPQAYRKESRLLGTGACITAARKVWSARDIAPTVELPLEANMLRAEITDLRRHGCIGVSTWSVTTTSLTDLAIIRDGRR